MRQLDRQVIIENCRDVVRSWHALLIERQKMHSVLCHELNQGHLRSACQNDHCRNVTILQSPYRLVIVLIRTLDIYVQHLQNDVRRNLRFAAQPWRRCCSPGWRPSTRCGLATGRCGRRSAGWGGRLKKRLRAAERDRPDVALRRRSWRAAQPFIDSDKRLHRRDRRQYQDDRPRLEINGARAGSSEPTEPRCVRECAENGDN